MIGKGETEEDRKGRIDSVLPESCATKGSTGEGKRGDEWRAGEWRGRA